MEYRNGWHLLKEKGFTDDVVILEDGLVKWHSQDDDAEGIRHVLKTGSTLEPVLVISEAEYQKHRMVILSAVARFCGYLAHEIEMNLEPSDLFKKLLEEADVAFVWFRDISKATGETDAD